MWTNCWLWALPRWLRGERKYLIVRWSEYNPWIPHAMLTDDLEDVEVEEAVPVNPRKGWRALIHSPFFKAKIKKTVRDE